MSSTFVNDFYVKSSPSYVILQKDIYKKYPAQIAVSLLKLKFKSTTVTMNPLLCFSKRIIITEQLQTKDKIYTKIYIKDKNKFSNLNK